MDRRTGILTATALTLAAAILGLMPLGESASAAADKPVTAEARARILSIGGDVTEILYALGLQSQIVAVDATSQFPAEALKEKKNVGYMRALSAEGVLSTSPGMILASRSSGPPDVIKALKSADLPYIEVPDDHDPQGVAGKVRLIAEAAGVPDKGETLAKEVEQQFTTLDADRKRITKPLRAIFVLSVQKGMATVAGTGTSGDAILKLAGLENAAQGEALRREP